MMEKSDLHGLIFSDYRGQSQQIVATALSGFIKKFCQYFVQAVYGKVTVSMSLYSP